jgi:hypothetical protein
MSRNKKSKHNARNLKELTAVATQNARARQSRALEEAELEQVAGGGKTPGEIIDILLGLILQ